MIWSFNAVKCTPDETQVDVRKATTATTTIEIHCHILTAQLDINNVLANQFRRFRAENSMWVKYVHLFLNARENNARNEVIYNNNLT